MLGNRLKFLGRQDISARRKKVPHLIRQHSQKGPTDLLWQACPVALLWMRPEEGFAANEAARELLSRVVGPRESAWQRWAAAVVARLQAQELNREILSSVGVEGMTLDIRLGAQDPAGNLPLALVEGAPRAEGQQDLVETVSTLSHELRTPLATIKSSLGLVWGGETGPLNEDQRHFLGMAMRNIDRLDRLVNDLLDVSRADAGQLRLRRQPCDVVALVRDVVDGSQSAAAGAGLTLEMATDLAECVGWLDGDKVVQMLANLVGNALKFTPRQGVVRVQVLRDPNPEWVQIEVRDNGPGMDSETLATALKPYQRSRQVDLAGVPGTGLGLHITGKLVRAHGGELGLDSRLGHGTRAWIRLPLEQDQGADEDPLPSVFD